MRITLFSDHLLHNQLQRIFDNTHGETQKIESVKTRTSKSLTQMRTRVGSSSAASMTATSSTGNSEINPSLFIKVLQYVGKISYHQVDKELRQQTKQLLCLPPEYIVTRRLVRGDETAGTRQQQRTGKWSGRQTPERRH
jgi:hypothetical protein